MNLRPGNTLISPSDGATSNDVAICFLEKSEIRKAISHFSSVDLSCQPAAKRSSLREKIFDTNNKIKTSERRKQKVISLMQTFISELYVEAHVYVYHTVHARFLWPRKELLRRKQRKYIWEHYDRLCDVLENAERMFDTSGLDAAVRENGSYVSGTKFLRRTNALEGLKDGLRALRKPAMFIDIEAADAD